MSTTSAPGADARSAELPDYPMPRAAGCPFDPPPDLYALQAQAPISRVRLWDGSTPWLVTRYEDMRTLLGDPRISSDSTRPHYPYQGPGQKERRTQSRAFIAMDDPEHARLRRMVTASFSIKRVEALRPAIQKIVDGLIDAMLAGPKPVNLVQAFALPVPSLVICELLGVPYADHGFFQANSRMLIKRDTTPEQARAATQRLVDYLDGIIGDKLAHPADDLLSTLAERVRAGELSRREAVDTGMLLLIAGHETTANMIALGTLALLQHPDQLAQLRDSGDPRLVASAVEELLRHLTIVHSGRRRVALEDIEIGGRTIRTGDGVILANDIGNRDPAGFPDPDRLDIARNPRHHVAFGFGVHQCLGQPLARVELQVVYSTLYRRIPALQLAVDLDEIPFKHDGLVYGVYELPVTW
ncbi:MULTISPECIES: cytochrome P450 [unclassified Streptomyces]|uniref:cytochrome P450 n=1 Tax=unclassified Streptomyces TaxID=2593676 RepID=UPI000B841354|nr:MULTISPECIES: cytochrome P450 [unclassified Streptomyces]MYQ85662.1 cytochrome P450 [Streptomyces sp. SID4936]